MQWRSSLLFAVLFALPTLRVNAQTARQGRLALPPAPDSFTSSEVGRSVPAEPSPLLIPAIVANPSNRTITIQAKATGLAVGDLLEFMLIGPKSSHGYEAFAQCDATPGEIRAAMKSIGLCPGQPADGNVFRYRPRGERLRITVMTPDSTQAVPIESFISLTDSTKTWSGFVFSGSQHMTNDTNSWLADTAEPFSIISTYNEACSIIDVREAARQEAVYGTCLLAKAGHFTAGAALQFHIEPLFRDGPHATNLTLAASTQEFLAPLKNLTTNATEVFLTVTFPSNITVREAIRAATEIDRATESPWVIPAPPPEGELYFRAFLPSPSFRDRTQRAAQPWELHMASGPNPATGTLVRIDEVWPDGADKATLETHSLTVTSGAELKTALAAHEGLPVIFVYASPEATVGAIMRFLFLSFDTRPTVYVFEEDAVGGSIQKNQ